MSTAFITGFPGFLGSELLPRVLARSPEHRAVCLIQPKFAALARQRVEEIAVRFPDMAGRVDLLEGDITKPDLGLSNSRAIVQAIGEIYHLAAIYDVNAPREIGMRINVEGTRHVLNLAERCPNLLRLHYISTCFVSGRHPGFYTERDLDVGQSFNNFYEETKFLAEVLVQERMQGGLPSTVYRPAVVTGDSQTGATQKYDGPYYVLRWLLKQPRLALMPVIGDPTKTRFNVVPRDFVVDAIAYLSGIEASKGIVYQLADPEPLTIDETLTAMAKATGRVMIRIPVPCGLAKFALDRVPGVRALMGFPSGVIDYFVHPAHYTVENMLRDLDGSGIRPVNFATYAHNLSAFLRRHPEIGSAAMA